MSLPETAYLNESHSESSNKTSTGMNGKGKQIHHCDYLGCRKVYSQKFRLQIHQRTHVNIS
jgi:hypothetical protein